MKILLKFTGLITPLLLLLLLTFGGPSYVNALIIPEELPSILSLVYSNIPPIKKGTDSRLGFGFRLGEHADFQVQFEIGPQQRTRPIGSSSSSSKRNADSDDYQQLVRKKQFPLNPAGKSWLEVWSKETRKKQNFNKDKHRDAVGAATGMPASPTMSETAYNQLQQLYDMNKPTKEETIGTIPAAELESRLKQLQTLRPDDVQPFKPLPTGAADSNVNEVDSKKPLAEVPFKPMPEATLAGTVKAVENGPEPRKNLRRRKNPSGNGPREKDKISADLADVSMD
ncbi:uncharacterized protein LOC134213411 [Armigeres subalbatus]|uniref:uncharacterized protein LOC134213411 n=1 Tax=Armigeres subalbatus TaxID=124917 RepID=UPI002ED4B232